MPDIKPCPHCGQQPRVYHGVYGGLYGDSVECTCDASQDCDANDSEPWPYTAWDLAVKRWNEYAERAACKT